MNKSKAGFTLIEVLVVVLILGILSSIALPQYRGAVDRAHVAVYLDFASKVREAQDLYYWEHHKYASNIYDLDIDFSSITSHCPSNIRADGSAWYTRSTCEYGVALDNTNGGNWQQFAINFCPSATGSNVQYGNANWCATGDRANIVFYYGKHGTKAGKIECFYRGTRGEQICKQFSNRSAL